MKKSLFLALAILAGSLTTTAFAAKKKDKKKKTVETVEVVKLATSSDSLSYAAGKAQTNGLLPFLKQKYNVEEKDLRGEGSITREHVQNNSSVRAMLGERGIHPEDLPPAESIKKLERRVKKQEQAILEQAGRLPEDGTPDGKETE